MLPVSQESHIMETQARCATPEISFSWEMISRRAGTCSHSHMKHLPPFHLLFRVPLPPCPRNLSKSMEWGEKEVERVSTGRKVKPIFNFFFLSSFSTTPILNSKLPSYTPFLIPPKHQNSQMNQLFRDSSSVPQLFPLPKPVFATDREEPCPERQQRVEYNPSALPS